MEIRRTLLLPGLACALVLASPAAHANVYGQVRGVVHDSNHKPMPAAHVLVHAITSDYHLDATTRADGSFSLPSVPFGVYTVTVSAPGFSTTEQRIELHSSSTAELHFELYVAGSTETVRVSADVETSSVTPTTVVTRANIDATPGADRTNSISMITDFVPGAYATHDMLHMRGGHQVSYLFDGVQIPNTNIASNVAAAISPQDIDQLEIQRGSYTADTGDRTYGVFNIAPANGFTRDREAVLTVTGGSQGQTDNQISFGDHSQRLGWYASANGSRSDYGLAPPIAQTYHDATNGFGGFGSLIFNKDTANQIRAVGQVRRDFFQIPYDPDPNSFENQQYDSSGLRDTQNERDAFAAVTWEHSFNASTALQFSPFYHYNQSDYQPGVADVPVATTSDRTSQYGGVQAQLASVLSSHSLSGGLYGFGQHDGYLFGTALPCPPETSSSCTRASASGGLFEAYASDSWQIRPWLTLQGGLRESYFTSEITDNVISPRVGAAIIVPKLHWVFRGFYGRFYQPPPLFTLSAPLLTQTPGVLPLHGERDEEHQFGVQIPWRGWLLDADTFRTRVNNFLDHANIGESSIFVPITIDGALIRAWELTLKSPRLWHTAQLHLAYSNQIAEQRGPITGGLLCAPGSEDCSGSYDYTPVDHDQRNTLSLGGDASLAHGWSASANWAYGSGFVNGDPNPATPYPNVYLPAHSSVDIAVRKSISDSMTIGVTATNIADQRVLLDNSLTFGGFHFSDPREVYGEVKWRFHF